MKITNYFFVLGTIVFFSLLGNEINAQPTSIYGRKKTSLNGIWDVIIDRFERGWGMRFYEDRSPKSTTDFVEYGFDNSLQLRVPGDWNSQAPELENYEGNIWYRKKFEQNLNIGKRYFIYFSGVNYRSEVWLNAQRIGFHEGGFVPFSFEITKFLKNGENTLIVKVDNKRIANGIPGLDFDWWNYGGITRDVSILETSNDYIVDYKAYLKNSSPNQIQINVEIDKPKSKKVQILIPELGVNAKISTDTLGKAALALKKSPIRWSFNNPKLYETIWIMDGDTISDQIGFRTIEVKGNEILLNGKPVFLKGVNFHEEIPMERRRANTDADAKYIISEIKALGCNFARTAHYPMNEHIVKEAERNGIMLWEEIPIWQNIDFNDEQILRKAYYLFEKMMKRDFNRYNVVVWSIANETKPSQSRNAVLSSLAQKVKKADSTRLVTTAFDNMVFDPTKNEFTLPDSLTKELDFISVNKYIGWYMPFPTEPENIKWSICTDKPLFFSEFGVEAQQGVYGNKNVASSWSEDYQADIYSKNLEMMKKIPNLAGLSPWVLFDFKSPRRLHPLHQKGWNRKGLISDFGVRKKAWYIMHDYYTK